MSKNSMSGFEENDQICSNLANGDSASKAKNGIEYS